MPRSFLGGESPHTFPQLILEVSSLLFSLLGRNLDELQVITCLKDTQVAAL